MRLKIHQEGREIVLTLLTILALINGSLFYFLPGCIMNIPIMIISLIFFLLVLNFFRLPKRHYKDPQKKTIVAPADGKIVVVEEVFEDAYFHDKRIQVSTFMNLFNVHANWTPVNGTVTHVSHQPGRFMSAYLPKSSTENERSTIVIRTEDGTEILMRQIAGAMARRIVTYAEKGENCSIDEHLGFIKFGSRVDLFLPLDSEILVSLGDKMTGNISTIARLK